MIIIRKRSLRRWLCIGLLAALFAWPADASHAAEQQKPKGYTYNIRQLVEKAKRKIREIDAKLAKKAPEKKVLPVAQDPN